MTQSTEPTPNDPSISQGEPTYDPADVSPAAQRSRVRTDRNEERRWGSDEAAGAPGRPQDYGGHHPDDTADPDSPAERP